MKTTPKKLEQETDDRVIADVPAVPGVIAYGATKKEALERVIAILKATGEKEAIAAAELVAQQYGGALRRLSQE